MSYKLKQYTTGFLLLLLAGFILASVSYITSIIPETTIPQVEVKNPWLIYSTTFNVNNSSYITVSFNPYFYYNVSYKFYIVVDTTGLNPPAYARQLTVYHTGGNVNLNWQKFNDTVIYATMNLVYAIKSIDIYFNTTASGVGILSFYDTNNITQALTYKPSQPVFISNKLILNFISWIAGIILVMDALRRFDLEI